MSSSGERTKLALARLRAWGKEKQSRMSTSIPVTVSGRNRPTTDVTNVTNGSKNTTIRNQVAKTKAPNEMKSQARGDSKVPPPKRTYVHVEAERNHHRDDHHPQREGSGENGNHGHDQSQRMIMFFDSSLSIGRVLDQAAKMMQLPNLNNRGRTEDDRLRIYHVEGGRLLEFHERLHDVVVDGNTLVLLRGVGPSSSS